MNNDIVNWNSKGQMHGHRRRNTQDNRVLFRLNYQNGLHYGYNEYHYVIKKTIYYIK